MTDPPGAVLVTGAAGAGVTSVLARLRDGLPGHRVVGDSEAAPGEAPLAVVLVVSATAPVVRSDGLRAAAVTARAGAVIGVVNKVDDHRAWRDVLAADRERLAAAAPWLAGIPWVGVAADPRLGEPDVDEAVAVLERVLADPGLARRTAERARQADAAASVTALEARRADVVAAHRSTRTGLARWRHGMQQARLELTHAARQRCAQLRSELLAEVAATTRRTRPGWEARVRQRCDDVLAAVDDEIEARLGQRPPDRPVAVPAAPRRARPLETRLMVVLGAGFGVGVAMVVARLTALAGGASLGGTVAGGIAGLMVTVWVVRARALLHDRALLERWVVDAVAVVRAEAEDRVSARMLAAEADRVARVDRRLAELETELRRIAARRRRFDAAATDVAVTDR